MTDKSKGVFMLAIRHDEAERLANDLEKVALQLGPDAQEFYGALREGLQNVADGKRGLEATVVRTDGD